MKSVRAAHIVVVADSDYALAFAARLRPALVARPFALARTALPGKPTLH